MALHHRLQQDLIVFVSCRLIMASSEQEANYPKITVDTIARICRERKDL